jgi:hypothetical protein
MAARGQQIVILIQFVAELIFNVTVGDMEIHVTAVTALRPIFHTFPSTTKQSTTQRMGRVA